MKISEIYEFLDKLSPFELQEKWDNSGLLVGNLEQMVNEVYLSLDIDSNLIENVSENSLIITHHPLIFKGLKSLDGVTYPSSLIYKMIQKNISLISMHTNFDKTHLNKYLATEVLGFSSYHIDEFICYINVDLSFDELLAITKEKLKLKSMKFLKTKEKLTKIALTSGSGGDLISSVRADCFLTGDLKYHQAFEAMENNLSLIDIKHYESEKFFGECLEKHLKILPIKAIITNSKNPFEYK